MEVLTLPRARVRTLLAAPERYIELCIPPVTLWMSVCFDDRLSLLHERSERVIVVLRLTRARLVASRSWSCILICCFRFSLHWTLRGELHTPMYLSK